MAIDRSAPGTQGYEMDENLNPKPETLNLWNGYGSAEGRGLGRSSASVSQYFS